MLMEVEKLLMTKNADAITLPTIVTIRHPNLFASALTIGPAKQKNSIRALEPSPSLVSSYILLYAVEYISVKQQQHHQQ
jgi:hypothetical protein